MAEAKANRDAAEPRGSQSNPGKAPEEVRYSREELIEGARGLLDVPGHAVEGALHGQSRETFTLGQAEKLVNAFLKHEDTTGREDES